MNNYLISVIIPIRVTSVRKDVIERLSFCISDTSFIKVEYIVVDDGSEKKDANLLKSRCFELGFKYVKTNACPTSPFNLARARNLGAQLALGKYVLFLDVDLLVYPEFYDDIYTEIMLSDMAHNSDVFLMFPVVYFNDDGFNEYKKLDDKYKKHFASQILLYGKFHFIEKYSYGTSCILVDRLYYLSIGGQDESYEGWGYEDYDFTVKMMKLSPLFPLPPKFDTMVGGNFMVIKRYYGWKAQYRLYGMMMARKGVYLYHVPHEVDAKYHNNKISNLNLFKKSLYKDLSKECIQTINSCCEKSLFLNKKSLICNYKLNFIFGKYEVFNYTQVNSWEEILEYFLNKKFTQIIFPNPYESVNLLELYKYCRKHNIKYIVRGRGALPGAIFHDPNGFLYDSKSYSQAKWDIPLSIQEEQEIKKYLYSLKTKVCASGKLTKDIKGQKLLSELTNSHKKKVLIILQSVSDKNVKLFGRGFREQVFSKTFLEKVISKCKNHQDFIYKNDPVETVPMFLQGAADNVHINDLISVSDMVITINSSMGLIASFLGKPVFTLGDSWYTLPGIAYNIDDENQLSSHLNVFKPSKEKVLRFAYYLRYKFYSFENDQLVKEDDFQIKAIECVNYKEIQTLDYGRVYFKDQNYQIGFNSILFKEYDMKSFRIVRNFVKKLVNRITNKCHL